MHGSCLEQLPLLLVAAVHAAAYTAWRRVMESKLGAGGSRGVRLEKELGSGATAQVDRNAARAALQLLL
jgi:hypothetical protein